MAITADLSKHLDKNFENVTLSELLAAPVSALAGVSAGDAGHLQAAFNIKTVGELGTNSYFRLAAALCELSG